MIVSDSHKNFSELNLCSVTVKASEQLPSQFWQLDCRFEWLDGCFDNTKAITVLNFYSAPAKASKRLDSHFWQLHVCSDSSKALKYSVSLLPQNGVWQRSESQFWRKEKFHSIGPRCLRWPAGAGSATTTTGTPTTSTTRTRTLEWRLTKDSCFELTKSK